MRLSWSLPFSRMSKPNCFSLSSGERCSSPLTGPCLSWAECSRAGHHAPGGDSESRNKWAESPFLTCWPCSFLCRLAFWVASTHYHLIFSVFQHQNKNIWKRCFNPSSQSSLKMKQCMRILNKSLQAPKMNSLKGECTAIALSSYFHLFPHPIHEVREPWRQLT